MEQLNDMCNSQHLHPMTDHSLKLSTIQNPIIGHNNNNFTGSFFNSKKNLYILFPLIYDHSLNLRSISLGKHCLFGWTQNVKHICSFCSTVKSSLFIFWIASNMYFKKSFGPNLQIVCLKDCVWSWCMYIYYTYTCLFWCSTFWWHNSRNLQCFIMELLQAPAKPGPAGIYWNSFRSSKFGKLSKLGRFSETLCRFAVNVWANWTEPIGYLSVFDTIHSEHNIHTSKKG